MSHKVVFARLCRRLEYTVVLSLLVESTSCSPDGIFESRDLLSRAHSSQLRQILLHFINEGR